MKDMINQENGDKCPFDLNFDPASFKPGDLVSYRVIGDAFMDMPFVGVIAEVFSDHITLHHFDGNQPPQGPLMTGSRESRPQVSEQDALQ